MMTDRRIELTCQEIRRVVEARPGLVVAGLCGAQGSGKSTLAAAVAGRLAREGIATAILSLDDLYLTRRQRQALADDVHPLLATRGVPGTHDIELGLRVISGLSAGEAVRLPRFDKAADDRAPVAHWPVAGPETRVLLLEGWCVGARPQSEEDLVEPVNALEGSEDKDGRWRRFANQALSGSYQRLFARLDRLILLAAPDFSVVCDWRIEQEHHLRRLSAEASPGLLTDREVARFVQHYERLTRHILAEMPARADLTLDLERDRSIRTARRRGRAVTGTAQPF